MVDISLYRLFEIVSNVLGVTVYLKTKFGNTILKSMAFSWVQ